MKTNYPQYKTALAVIAAVVLLTACGKQIDFREFEFRRGLAYRANESTPFTGTMKNVPWGSALPTAVSGTCVDEFTDGLRDGKRICSSMKGIKLEESEWKEGKRNGVERRWEVSTSKFWKLTHYVNDQKNGLEEVHNPFENEALITRRNWVDNQKSGNEKKWDITGKILRTDLNWVDGKQTGVVRYNTRQESYKNGILDGTQIYYTDPQGLVRYMPKEMSDQISKISNMTEILQGGSDFIGDVPGMAVEKSETYANGVYQPNPALQGCVNAKEAAYKVETMNFQYNEVTNVNIIHWEKECAAGQTAPASGQVQTTGSSVSACLDAKIAAVRKTSPDELIRNDVLDEWEQECKTRK